MIAAQLRIISIMLVFPILLGQTGLSLHTLYCFCKEQASTSLFFLQEASPLSAKHLPAEDEKGCCTSTDACHRNSGTKGEMRCEKEGVPCNTHTINYIKLHNLSLEISADNQEFEYAAAIAQRAVYLPVPLLLQARLEALHSHPAHAPPGRMLRILHQSFLC